ncbi:MAG TPA: OmpA family protein [Desulfohalobiaceae bacterium]|nr:OmpA family protein [Desulfohalobiaceae bacterium]
MKKIIKNILLFTCIFCLWTLFTSCSVKRFYVPEPKEISPFIELKKDFQSVCSVNLINAQTDTRQTKIGDYTHKWWANLRLWTDSSIHLLSQELKKRNIKISEKSPKYLKLSISYVDLFWQFKKIGCVVNLQVKTGTGYTVNIEEKNISHDLYDSCDGAVSKAVATLLKNPRIRDYLTSKAKIKDSDYDGVPDPEDQCPETPCQVDVDKYGCPLDSDNDGVPDYQDKCPNTPSGIQTDKFGCPFDTDQDGVPNYKDKCPKTPNGAQVDKQGCWNSQVPLFDFDKSSIKPQYYSILNRVAQVIEDNPGLNVEIQGYADIIGTKEYNQKLSLQRAKAVRDYLINKGVSKKRLEVEGFGYSRPRAPSDTEKGRSLNRRVEFQPIYDK